MIESLGNWSVIAIFAVCPLVPRIRADLSRKHLGSLAKCAKETAKCAFQFRILIFTDEGNYAVRRAFTFMDDNLIS